MHHEDLAAKMCQVRSRDVWSLQCPCATMPLALETNHPSSCFPAGGRKPGFKFGSLWGGKSPASYYCTVPGVALCGASSKFQTPQRLVHQIMSSSKHDHLMLWLYLFNNLSIIFSISFNPKRTIHPHLKHQPRDSNACSFISHLLGNMVLTRDPNDHRDTQKYQHF